MSGLRIVHCADCHLDSSFVKFGLRDSGAVMRARELKASFSRIVDLVRAERADVLLIAGDFFEDDCVKKTTVQSVIDEIKKKIPGVPVFIAPGNHDPLTSTSYYSTMDWPSNVTVFGPEWRAVEIPGRNAFVHGWGFHRPHVGERRLAELRIPPSGAVHVALVHGSEDGFPTEHDRYLPFSRDECTGCGADYVALGHIHRHRVVVERPGGGGPLAVYPGSPESLTFGQKAEHGVMVGTVGKDANDLRLVSVGEREHFSMAVDVTGAATEEQVVERIDKAVGEGERSRHLYRLTLTGEVDPELDLDAEVIEALEAELAGSFHYVEIRSETRPARDLEDIAKRNTLFGRFTKEMLAQLEAATAKTDDEEREEESKEIELAIRYGLRALEGRR